MKSKDFEITFELDNDEAFIEYMKANKVFESWDKIKSPERLLQTMFKDILKSQKKEVA